MEQNKMEWGMPCYIGNHDFAYDGQANPHWGDI